MTYGVGLGMGVHGVGVGGAVCVTVIGVGEVGTAEGYGLNQNIHSSDVAATFPALSTATDQRQ